jgi:hypothetical protein
MATKQTDHSRDLGNLEGKMTIVISLMFAFIPLLFAVGGSLFWLINDARSTLGEKIGGLGDRLTRVETTLAALQTNEMRFATATSGSLARIEEHLAAATKGTIAVPTLLISSADALAILNALKGKFDSAVAYNAIGKVGDVVSDTKLFDFPEDLIAKYPLLKTMRYAFDIKSQVLIVSEADRVVAVLA